MIPFDPARSRLLVPAPSDGIGSWAGAPGAFRDGADVLVCYRLRKPTPIRGYELRIAVVERGALRDLWTVRKDELHAESIERAAIVRDDRTWRAYVSYVAEEDRQWRIGLIEARSIETLDARTIRTVLHPSTTGTLAVKDPWILGERGRWRMFVSCGRRVGDQSVHARGDALSTGATKSESGLAESEDGVNWSWRGIVFGASDAGWDRFTARLTCATRDDRGWIACYDGSASLDENYEERCGLARSGDLLLWERASVDGPAIGTPRGPGGVRYVAVAESGEVFFEYTRADGAHELRAILEGTGGASAL